MNPAPAPVADLDLPAEAHLDSSFEFPHPISPYALAPRSVFLTGATGFLGVYLIDELMRSTGAKVCCLVRAADASSARQRLLRHLQQYELWRDEFEDRISAVAGDLALPRLGLSDEQFLQIAADNDVIYHSAGWLNMAFPYGRLKPVNVEGTKEILRLAGAVQTKPLHFLSSMVVFFTDAHTNDPLLKESDAPRFHASLKGGYSRSKWVSDRLVAAAQERGLPTCIYRPVRIMGHSQTGTGNDLSDVLPLLLKACILIGKYPTFDIRVTMVPVDFVSRSIVHLMGQEKSWGKAFHFFHPEPIEWRELMAIFQRLGYPLDELPYDQWWRELKKNIPASAAEPERKAFLATAMLAMTAPHFLLYKRPPLDWSNLREGLTGSGIEYPVIDEKLVGAYLSYWRKIDYIPAPASQLSLT